MTTDKKNNWPIKTCATDSQRFCSRRKDHRETG